MKTLKACLVASAAALVAAGAPAQASITTYIASDVGATSLGPNSQAEQGVFLGAAGPTGIVTFDPTFTGPLTLSATTGHIATALQPRLRLRPVRRQHHRGRIPLLLSGRLRPGPQSATFTFNSPISSFGLYVSGTQSVFRQDTITFTDATGAQTIKIPLIDSGMSFVGFTDPGASIFSVSINVTNDYIGLDDVLYSASVPGPVPGAGLAGLAALALAGLYARARRA